MSSNAYTHILLRQRVLADTLTPIAVYQRLANAPYTYLLESIEGGERWGRFSVIGLPARERIWAKNGVITHVCDDKVVNKIHENPLTWLQKFKAQWCIQNIPDDLLFSGGLVGYFAYDAVGYIEKRLAQRPDNDPLNIPDVFFLLSDTVVVLDNLRGEANILVLAKLGDEEAMQAAQIQLDVVAKKLEQPFSCPALTLKTPDTSTLSFTYELGETEYKTVVNKVRDYIIAGDVMQVVVSQRMSLPYSRSALDLYRALRITNPSPYMYLLDLGTYQIVGSSPEILARLENRKVTVRPIAGTRRRGLTPDEDLALEKELLTDEKECAEHTMLIDLGRNDIGRVCKIGTVTISEKMVIERYSHVMHIVSNVEGEAGDGVDAMGVFKATFPAGTLSGAPKIRAMEIIDEVEVSRRGIYGGAVGYWSWQGNMDMAIAIRTGLIKGKWLYIQAGAGIVYDSNPDFEWQETINKLNALLKAVAML